MSTFKVSAELIFGDRAIERLAEMPHRSVFIITDGFLVSSGMVERLVRWLPRGARHEVYSDVRPDPTQELVDRGVGSLRSAAPDLLIAFGGGSCIDAAKAILHAAVGEGMARPHFMAVPTTAGTGSEVTNFAVITRGDTKAVLIDDALVPDTALLDAALTRSVPPRITADTGMDVLTHALEALVSTGAGPFSDAMAIEAARAVFDNLPDAFEDGDRMRARARMIEASAAAGAAFTNAGLGACHSLAHALGGRFHVAHGRLNAILLPYVMRFNAARPGARGRYGEAARRLGLADERALIGRVLDLREELGIEPRLSALEGIGEGRFESLLGDIARDAVADRCTPTNPRPVSLQDMAALARAAFQGER